MKVITAVEECIKWDDEAGLHVFLAGGISGCADWQSRVLYLMENTDFVFHNPRRNNFPINDPNAGVEQVTWEFNHLRQCDIILFWFAPETLNPIVLFELGAWSMTDKPILVGCHPDYQRIQDVKIQMSLARPGLKIHSSIDSLVYDLQKGNY